VDLNDTTIAIRPYLCTHPDGKLVLSSFVPYVGAIAGINGGFFGGTQSLSTVVYPFEVKAQNPAIITRPSGNYPVTRSMFGIADDGTLAVDWIYHFSSDISDIYRFSLPTQNSDSNPAPTPQEQDGTQYENLWWGLGGGPTLVKDSMVNVTYNEEVFFGSGVEYDNTDPRTAVGYTKDNHVIMLVADGRNSSWSNGISLPDLAQLLIDLGCVEAMNLDGGGSTQIAIGNQIVDTPSESRAVPTILAVVWADSAKGPAEPTYEKIIDTGDPGVLLNPPNPGSTWFESANSGWWGTTKALLNQKGVGDDYVKFPLNLPKSTVYQLYGWWVASSNRCNDTPFIINHKNGADTVRVNQTTNGSSWQFIGEYTFSGDSTDEVRITDGSKDPNSVHLYVVADAIRLTSFDPGLVSSIETEKINLVNDFILNQNYPNPFNPSTTIRYCIPLDVKGQMSNVQLKVYNILGQDVATLVNEEKAPGVYEVTFDGTNLTSGIYFYRIQTGNYSDVKKMIILK
ncbi:MAG: phosphodiester glycosidase family protein, partial [Ignavibacteriales bacterium]|nr:phosphodiester glycosidase family protein [Ignavibacteriales bacterium]